MKRLLPVGLSALLLALAGTAWAQPGDFAYYPLKVGNEWTYRAGKEKVVIRCERAMPLELARGDKPGKTEKVDGFVLKVQSGARAVTEQVAILNDGVYRFSTADKAIKPPLRFLKAPLDPRKMEDWKVECKTEDGKSLRGTFVSGTAVIRLNLNGKDVELPTITVTSKDFMLDDEPMALAYWFAQGYGVVKQHVRVGKHDVTLELESFRPAP